ncbi:MAG: hypothetical protein ACERKT_08495, partial [Acidobacteriota bacterium]
MAALLAALFALPMAALVVQAFGDTWRFPALFPQELGLRGFSDAFAGGSNESSFAGHFTSMVTRTNDRIRPSTAGKVNSTDRGTGFASSAARGFT